MFSSYFFLILLVFCYTSSAYRVAPLFDFTEVGSGSGVEPCPEVRPDCEMKMKVLENGRWCDRCALGENEPCSIEYPFCGPKLNCLPSSLELTVQRQFFHPKLKLICREPRKFLRSIVELMKQAFEDGNKVRYTELQEELHQLERWLY